VKKDMGKITDATGVLVLLILVILLVLALYWCAVTTVSIFTGKGFITSTVIIVGIMVLIELFSSQIRRIPPIKVQSWMRGLK
jgi:hypothetical protein